MADEVAVRRPGLQAERTYLAWTRTGLAFLANGALLLFRYRTQAPLWVHLGGALLALALFVLVFLTAAHRRRILLQRPLPVPLASHGSVTLVALGAVAMNLPILALVFTG